MSEMKVDVGGGRSEIRPVTYPANSDKSKKREDKPRVEPVVTGTVVTRKKSVWSKAAGSIVSDSPDSVGQYIVLEVLLPAAKSLISDVITQGVERMLYGESSRSRYSNQRSGYTAYNRVQTPQQPERLTRRERSTHDFDRIILDNRGEAEDVLDGLKLLIEKYGAANVSDFYDLIGQSSEFVDNKWGWYSMAGSQVIPRHGGYFIKLPPVEPLTN